MNIYNRKLRKRYLVLFLIFYTVLFGIVLSFGLAINLIGSMMLLVVGLWAGTLCGSFAAFIINSIWIYFCISVVAILFVIVSLIKIEEREEKIPKTYYTDLKEEKVIEKKAIRN